MRYYNVCPENIYNIDGTGFCIGSAQRGRVIINAQIRSQFQAHPGRQEWVTVIECICGDGGVINPLVIFKGAKIASEWITNTEVPNGWSLPVQTKVEQVIFTVWNGCTIVLSHRHVKKWARDIES